MLPLLWSLGVAHDVVVLPWTRHSDGLSAWEVFIEPSSAEPKPRIDVRTALRRRPPGP